MTRVIVSLLVLLAWDPAMAQNTGEPDYSPPMTFDDPAVPKPGVTVKDCTIVTREGTWRVIDCRHDPAMAHPPDPK